MRSKPWPYIGCTFTDFVNSTKKARAAEESAKIDIYISQGFSKGNITAIKRNHTITVCKYVLLEDECRALEDELDIAERWTPGTADYEMAIKQLAVRQYQKAVDDLEHLVVQRLFELTKLRMSGTGMSTHVGCYSH